MHWYACVFEPVAAGPRVAVEKLCVEVHVIVDYLFVFMEACFMHA